MQNGRGQFDGGGMRDGRGGEHFGRGAGIAFIVLSILVFALVALGIWALTRGRARGRADAVAPSAPTTFQGPEPSARATLDQRFARGEIDSATYLHQIETFRLAYLPAGTYVPPAAPTIEQPVVEVGDIVDSSNPDEPGDSA